MIASIPSDDLIMTTTTAKPPAPPSQARSIISFFSGNLGATIISLVASLLVTRWTAPYQMGLWNFALLFVTYVSALQLGVFNGLNRQLPYYVGRGEVEKSLRMAEVAYAWCMLLSIVSVAVLVVVALYLWHESKWDVLFTTLAIGTVLVCSWSLQYLTVSYSANAKFGQLARKSMLVAAIGLPMALLVRAFDYTGLLVRAAVLAVLASLALHNGRPLRARPKWDQTTFVELVRVGFPIWILGHLGALFMTLDRLVLADSPQALGYYTIAVQFGTMSSMIPMAFNAVLYPQMARQYGENHVAMDLWSVAMRASLWASAASIGAGIVAWISIPYVVQLLLPGYTPGIVSAQWASLTGLAMGFSVFGNIFNVLGRQYLYLAAASVGLALFFGAWLLLTKVMQQPALVSAAQSMLVATFATSMLSAVLSRSTCRSHDRQRDDPTNMLRTSSKP